MNVQSDGSLPMRKPRQVRGSTRLDDESQEYDAAVSRQNSLIRRLSDDEATLTALLQTCKAAMSSDAPAPVPAADDIPSNHVASRASSQYAELKAAHLQSLYAMNLLESDLNHYRHLYYENERKQVVQGRLKYFTAPSCKIVVPFLWLEEPWRAVENLRKASVDADDSISPELNSLPALRQRFAVVRKQEIDRVRMKPRSQPGDVSVAPPKEAPEGKAPAASLPGKGTMAALKVATEKKIEAASAPLQPPPAKKAPMKKAPVKKAP